jgi:hypothetical protein
MEDALTLREFTRQFLRVTRLTYLQRIYTSLIYDFPQKYRKAGGELTEKN